jgi:hypothetical protein
VERHDARPDVELVVLVVVERWAGADLARALLDRQHEHRGGLELLAGGDADVVPAAGDQPLGERVQRAVALLGVLDRPRGAVQDDGTIVDRVVEGRARQHQAVDERHGEADLRPARERAQHAAGGRAVQVDLVAGAGVERRDDGGATVVDEADVADEAVVEDRVQSLAVVMAARRQAAELRAWGLQGSGAVRAGPPFTRPLRPGACLRVLCGHLF